MVLKVLIIIFWEVFIFNVNIVYVFMCVCVVYVIVLGGRFVGMMGEVFLFFGWMEGKREWRRRGLFFLIVSCWCLGFYLFLDCLGWIVGVF